MNRFFKRRKIRLFIIPHSSEKVHMSKFLFVFIPVLLLILTILTAYLVIMTGINLKNINKYTAVKKTKSDVIILSVKEHEVKENLEDIKKGIVNLKNEIKNIIPVYNFMSGINNTEDIQIQLTSNLDTLLQITDEMKNISDTSIKILSYNRKASYTPSLVPVNGWVLRKYGKVKDPYTETNKFSSGILFVSGLEEKVFSTAEGDVIFAGSKGNLGNTIIISHGDCQTVYAHLSNIIVSVGEKVKKGEQIGNAGKTGKTLSSSLFYRIDKGDSSIDPSNSFQIPTFMLYDTLSSNL